MRTCGYCGHTVNDDSSFCPKCGKALIASEFSQAEILAQIKKKRRDLRIKISAGIGAMMGIGICAIQTNTADMIFHSLTSFIVYL